jgi:predicted dehydrogenase
MTAEIRAGLIGYGLGGRAFHAPYLRTIPGFALHTIVSRDFAKVHADLPDTTVVPDVTTLLGESSIDLVVVSSPDALHAGQAVAALEAGKHVVVDKPFATSLADARRVADAANAAGKLAIAFQNRRWDADFLTLRDLIDRGELGDIVELESRFDRWRPEPATTWKDAREGGSWFDLGPHLIDQALQLLGQPLGITADIDTRRPGAPAPDYFHAILRYPNARAILHSSKLQAAHSLRFAVHGTRGSWVKHGLDVQEAATVGGALPEGADWGRDPVDGTLTRDGETHEVPTLQGDYRCFWLAVAAAIRGAGPNPIPPEDAIAVLTVLEAGMQSTRERREISLPARQHAAMA